MAELAVKIMGLDKQWHDLAWARARYGSNALTSEEGSGDRYRLVMAQEVTGNTAIRCTVLQKDGVGQYGQVVCYMYPEPVCHTDLEVTGGGGIAEHSMGPGEKYNPAEAMGPVSWRVRDSASDRIRGLGWLAGTDHQHLDIVLQWIEEGTAPEPEPGGCSGVLAALLKRLGIQMAPSAG